MKGAEEMNFNVQATTWDNEKRINRAKIIAKEISHIIDIQKHYRLLDFGCGTGLLAFNFASKVADITCIDTSQGMIDVLNLKIQQYKVNNMRAYQQELNNEPILRPEYDLIYTSMALHHIVDLETTLEKLFSLLKKDGYLCIVDLDEDDGSFHKLETEFNGHNGFKQDDLQEILRDKGYENIESHTFYHDNKIIDDLSINYSLFMMVGRRKK